MQSFEQAKAVILNDLHRGTKDKSPKGFVDSDIVELVQEINDHPNYVTTSSCSGRAVIFEEGSQHREGKWLYNSHSSFSFEAVACALAKACGNAQLKFEPFILHVRCRNLDSAVELLSVSTQSGFRESGIVLGKSKKKIIVAVRTTSIRLDIPVVRAGQCLVSRELLIWLAEDFRKRFTQNEQLRGCFRQAFQRLLPNDEKACLHVPDWLTPEKESTSPNWVFVIFPATYAESMRTVLTKCKGLDRSRANKKLPDGSIAIPVLRSFLAHFDSPQKACASLRAELLLATDTASDACTITLVTGV